MRVIVLQERTLMKRNNKTIFTFANPLLIGLMLLSSILIPLSALSIGKASSHNQAGTPEANLIALGLKFQPPTLTGQPEPTLISSTTISNTGYPAQGNETQSSQEPYPAVTQTLAQVPIFTPTLTPEGFIAPTPTITDTSNPNFTATLGPTQTQPPSNSPSQAFTSTRAAGTQTTSGTSPSATTASTPSTSGQLCGEISNSMVLTKAASPYVVSCDITIDSQTVITLEAGAILKLAKGVNIIVNGTLYATALPETPVTFTSIKDDTGGDTNRDGSQTNPTAGDWGSIQVSSIGFVNLTSAVIQYGTNAVNVSSGEADLDTASITDNSVSGITSTNGGRIIVSNSQILRNPLGIKVTGGSLSVIRCTISQNDQGIRIEGTPILTINHNNISNNSSFGIFNANSPTHISAKNNWWGSATGPKPYPNATGNGVNFASHHDATCNCDVVDDIFVDAQPWLTAAP
jgi:hypothetical protein